MRNGFLQWFRDGLAHIGLTELIEGVLAVVALAVLLGLVPIGSSVLFAVTSLVAVVVLVSFDPFGPDAQVDLYRRLLVRRYAIGADMLKDSYRIVSWKDVHIVSSNGDVRETITIRATVEGDGLDFYKIYTGPGWDQPRRYRRGVRVEVRDVLRTGVEGVCRDVVTSWSERGNLEIVVDFGESVPRGGEIGLQVEVHWPGRCIPLMLGRAPEQFALTFQGLVHCVDYLVVLPAGSDAFHDVIGLMRGRDTFESSCARGRSQEMNVRVIARDVEPGRRVGLRLDLK